MDAVTNVSASIDSSLAALRQQGKGAGVDMRAMRQARQELKKIELATLCEAVLEVRSLTLDHLLDKQIKSRLSLTIYPGAKAVTHPEHICLFALE